MSPEAFVFGSSRLNRTRDGATDFVKRHGFPEPLASAHLVSGRPTFPRFDVPSGPTSPNAPMP